MDFASAALSIALATSNLTLVAPSIAHAQYGKILYEVRAVHDGRGIGGIPAYCTTPTRDLVMIVYTVQNLSDEPISGPAVPRMLLVDDKGVAHRAERRLTDALTGKLLPYLRLPQGVLQAGQVVVLADVFVTPRFAVRNFPWLFGTDPLSAAAAVLPRAVRMDPQGC